MQPTEVWARGRNRRVLGNITHKSGQGSYLYDPATDRLTQVGARSYTYDDNGNVLSDGERTLTWTAQNMVRSLQRGGQAWSLLYDADGTRVVREEAASNSATYNVGPTYELRFDGAELSEARISVLGATGRVVAEVFAERTALEENGLWEHHKKFVHDDHLGSAHMISDREGSVEARVLYGPWGVARDGNNWSLPVTEAALDELPAGFTGHQPELDVGLINMRGRMYDPAVARFMSVDPVIENALEVGTWNAYSYVLNRPLSLVDPTGLAAGTQADIERNESFLAEQGFVGADYHDVEAYYANIEFWKPYKAQTHGPRREEETKKSGDGKPVQAVGVYVKAAGDSNEQGCAEHDRSCQVEVFVLEATRNTRATKKTIEDWIVLMEIALMVMDGAAILALARKLAQVGLRQLAKTLIKRCSRVGKCAPKSTLKQIRAQVDPKKWDYIFGKAAGAKGAAHNAPRTAQNLNQMRRIGIHDTGKGRKILQSHFDEVVNTADNVVEVAENRFGKFEVRESLLFGPGGSVKLETTWQVMEDGTRRFTTLIPRGKGPY